MEDREMTFSARGLIPKRPMGPYSAERCRGMPPRALLAGIAEFNQGLFFEQHETLEALWRSEPDDIRYLYHGILLVGVGFFHLRRGNFHGAVSKLEGGLDKLNWFDPACQGVNVRALIADATTCLERLRQLGPDRIRDFDWALVPKISLLPGPE